MWTSGVPGTAGCTGDEGETDMTLESFAAARRLKIRTDEMRG